MNDFLWATVIYLILVFPGAILIGRLLRARQPRTRDELEQQRYEQLQQWGRRP